MSEPRDLGKILDAIIPLVPVTETELRARLVSVRMSVDYTPPESMGRCWRLASQALIEAIPEPTLDWHYAVDAIFRGEL